VIVAVGSTRGPKVEAVRRVLAQLGDRASELAQAEVVAVDVTAGGTPPTPLSLDELLDGARSRAHLAVEALQTQGRRADMAIGMEGGIDLRRSDPGGRRGFLMSWAYVTDGRRGAHGCGGAIEVPRPLLDRVVTDGVELAEAIDAFAREHDVRSRQGAWGVLTGGLFDRTRSFEIALINALAPFYNEAAYE
jgi:inosine/xanthosine triphosphatase